MDQTSVNNSSSLGPFICKPSVTMGRYCITNEEIMNIVENNTDNSTADLTKMRDSICKNMKIKRKYICRPPETLWETLSQQKQNDLFIKIGLDMAIPTIQTALHNADLDIGDIHAISFTSQSPFPFPAFTNNVMNAMGFHEDCVQIPTNTMGCAGGSSAMNSAVNFLSNKPNKNALVLSVELCSLAFRPTKSGLMWLITAALFGDACSAIVVRGRMSPNYDSPRKVLRFVHGKQRRVPDTTRASYFEYHPEGYHFIMTKELTNIVKENAPRFCTDLTMEAFGKVPKDIKVNIIHPGGAKMIADLGVALNLGGTRTESLAFEGMENGGNTVSSSIIYMLERVWDELLADEELIMVGLGPGFVMDGVAMKTVDAANTLDR